MRSCIAVASLAVSAGLAAAQCQPWVQQGGTGPSPRQNHQMAWDGSRVMLFGGYRGGTGFNAETWVWDGESWAPVFTTGPGPLANFGLAPAPGGGGLILFGGFNVNAFGDTWAWNSAAQTWTPLSPATAPSPRYNHAMAYDAARDRIVLFGGWMGSRASDTWLFDGTTWTQVFPATVPAARTSHAMIYDSARERVVMFGGYRGGSIAQITSFLADTWEWNGTNWTLSPATGPIARQYHNMAYSESGRVAILSGGSNTNSTRVNDTWAYDGTSWTQLTNVDAPGNPRDQHAMAYEPGASGRPGRILLHGGYQGAGIVQSDTWAISCAAGCVADMDDGSGSGTPDGGVDISDLLYFLVQFEAGSVEADLDNGSGTGTPDGGVDISDLLYFLVRFEGGC